MLKLNGPEKNKASKGDRNSLGGFMGHLLGTPFHNSRQIDTLRKDMEEQHLRLFQIEIKLVMEFVFLEGL